MALVPRRSILLFDRGYPSFDLLAYLTKHHKGYFLFRCPAESTFSAVQAFVQSGRREAYIALKPSGKYVQGLSAKERKKARGVHLRVIRLVSPVGKISVLLTNLLNQSRFPREEIIELYFRRWAVEDHMRRSSRREGFGDILAEGVKRVAQHLGGAFPEMGVSVKRGCAPHIHDPRTRWGTLFNQVISNMGSQEDIDMTMRFSAELGLDRPASDSDEHVAFVQSKTGPKRQFEECLGFCYFQASTLQTMIDTLNCLTGTSFDKDECLGTGRRVVNLLRMFNKREGMTREDDGFSPRLAESPADGPGAGRSMAPGYHRIRQAYCGYMGWDEDGMPTRETLEDLGLGFTIQGPATQPAG